MVTSFEVVLLDAATGVKDKENAQEAAEAATSDKDAATTATTVVSHTVCVVVTSSSIAIARASR